MALSRRLRFEILKRDNHRCRYCGAAAHDVALAVDHVMPVALGGTDAPENLVAACVDCNTGKSSMSPHGALPDTVDPVALEQARLRREQEYARAVRQAELAPYREAFRRGWVSGKYVSPDAIERAMNDCSDMQIPHHVVQSRAYEACIRTDIPDDGRWLCFRQTINAYLAMHGVKAFGASVSPFDDIPD